MDRSTPYIFFDPSIVPILVIFMTTSVFVCYLQIVTTTNLQSGLKNNSPFEAKKFVCIFLCINVQLWKVKYTYKLTQSSEYSCFMLITTKLKQVSHIHTTYTSDHPHSLCKWAVQLPQESHPYSLHNEQSIFHKWAIHTTYTSESSELLPKRFIHTA